MLGGDRRRGRADLLVDQLVEDPRQQVPLLVAEPLAREERDRHAAVVLDDARHDLRAKDLP